MTGMRLPSEGLRLLILGTTGMCNASCIHCPTGKLSTAASPRTPMSMNVFRKIIDDIVEFKIPVTGAISFGLFGDGLVDPFVVERAQYLRSRLPNVTMVVNTNGAAFNKTKHTNLHNLAPTIVLHCESLVAETFDELMQPLRAERVFPKYDEILESFPGQVIISIPISRKNETEYREIENSFLRRGAVAVAPSPLFSRCAEDLSAFEKLARNPVRHYCGPDALDTLIIDCDGKAVICCNDFAREEAIGSIEDGGILALLTHHRRSSAWEKLSAGRHAELSTCRKCLVDAEPMPPAL